MLWLTQYCLPLSVLHLYTYCSYSIISLLGAPGSAPFNSKRLDVSGVRGPKGHSIVRRVGHLRRKDHARLVEGILFMLLPHVNHQWPLALGVMAYIVTYFPARPFPFAQPLGLRSCKYCPFWLL